MNLAMIRNVAASASLRTSFDKFESELIELDRQESRRAELQLAFISGMVAVVLIAILVFGSGLAHAGAQDDIASEMAHSNWQHADVKLEKVLSKHPDHALAHYWLAQVRMKEGDAVSARDHLEQAKQLDPKRKFVSRPQVLSDLEAEIALAFAPTSFTPDSPSQAATQQTQGLTSDITDTPSRIQEAASIVPVVAAGVMSGAIVIGLFALLGARKRKQKAADSVRDAEYAFHTAPTSPLAELREREEESKWEAARQARAQNESQIRRRVPTPAKAYEPTFPVRRSSTVVNNNTTTDSNDDFASVVMVGQMMSRGSSPSFSQPQPAAVEQTETRTSSFSQSATVDTGGSSNDTSTSSSTDTGGGGGSMD